MPEIVYNLVFQDNVVCLPAKLAHQLGGMGQICVVYKVTSLLHLIDPNSCQCELEKKHTEICCAMFLRISICSNRRLMLWSSGLLVVLVDCYRADRAHADGGPWPLVNPSSW